MAHSSKNGIVNRHNYRYWSDENPKVFYEVHTSKKVNAWVCFYRIDSSFILGNLSGVIYLNLLD